MSHELSPRIVEERLLRLDEESVANREYWSRLSGEERVALLWEMVNEARAIKGLTGDEPRLQRSVERVLRG